MKDIHPHLPPCGWCVCLCRLINQTVWADNIAYFTNCLQLLYK